MKFKTGELVILAVFGALWGVVEISFGSLLHILNVPLSGLFMATIGITIAIIGRLYVPKPGSTFFIGLIAALLKMFSLGGIIINPMIAIIAEASLAEMVLTAFRYPRRSAFVIAGGLAVLWTLIHPFFTQSFLAGRGVLVIWLDLIDEGTHLFGLNPNTAWIIIVTLILLRFILGAVAGWVAWDLGHIIQKRRRTIK